MNEEERAEVQDALRKEYKLGKEATRNSAQKELDDLKAELGKNWERKAAYDSMIESAEEIEKLKAESEKELREAVNRMSKSSDERVAKVIAEHQEQVRVFLLNIELEIKDCVKHEDEASEDREKVMYGYLNEGLCLARKHFNEIFPSPKPTASGGEKEVKE